MVVKLEHGRVHLWIEAMEIGLDLEVGVQALLGELELRLAVDELCFALPVGLSHAGYLLLKLSFILLDVRVLARKGQ